MLDKEQILSCLSDAERRAVAALHIFQETDSTNNQLLTSSVGDTTGFHLCFAESQTQGKGRHGHYWHSPSGGVYCSVLLRCEQAISVWLGLMTAVEIVVKLKQFGVDDIGIKWPNDIYCRLGKLGGILVERKGDLSVVGVGINRTRSDEFEKSAGLEQIMTKVPEYNQLVAGVAAAVMRGFRSVEHCTVTELVQRYQQFDFLKGKHINVLAKDGVEKRGVAYGITQDAGLCVRHDDTVQVYYATEVSISQ